MSNWIGGLPPQPKSNDDNKKSKKADHGGQPKTFFGGAIPPTPPKMPKLPFDALATPKVKVAPTIPSAKPGAPSSPKAPPSTPPSIQPSTPSPPPPPPPPSPSSPKDPTPPPFTSPPISSPPPLSLPVMPARYPSVFDQKEKKKKKKKKKLNPPPPRQPTPCYNYDEDLEGDDKIGEGSKQTLFFAISHIPKTRESSIEDDNGRYEKQDFSGLTSPRLDSDEDVGPDIPPEVPRYMRGSMFASIFGKQIDARNLVDVGAHGWHISSKAPYDITDTGDTVHVGPHGWHEPQNNLIKLQMNAITYVQGKLQVRSHELSEEYFGAQT